MSKEPQVSFCLSMGEAWAVVAALERDRVEVQAARALNTAAAQRVREGIEAAYRDHLQRVEVGNA